jgi:hypothetical protein
MYQFYKQFNLNMKCHFPQIRKYFQTMNSKDIALKMILQRQIFILYPMIKSKSPENVYEE